MSDDIEELISELDLDDPILLGHSMGGKTVMRFAQTYSDVSSAIIVADISPRSYKVHHDKIVEGLQAVPVGSLQKRTDAKSYMMPHIQDEGVVGFLMKSLYWREKGDLQFRFNLDVLADSLEDVGEAVMEKPYSGQALFIYGGASNYVRPERDFQDIDLLFPNNQKTSLEGAGHWLHAEQPDAFYNAVSGFIANLD
jgi:pimeloyl-ACP methyl ester carboxylesterase